MSGNLLKSLALKVFHQAGGTKLLGLSTRDRVRILMYHRFPDQSELPHQCALLASAYHPVSMTQVAAWSRGELRLPPDAVAVTIDDGYKDFFTLGAPVFRKYKIPVTLFLTTDLPDRHTWLWTDQTRYLVKTARAGEVRIEVGDLKLELNLESEGRDAIARRLIAALKSAAEADRQSTLARLPQLFKADLPVEAPSAFQPATWADITSAIADGVEIGAHTRTHPILSRLPDTAAIEREIIGSRDRIEAETGQKVRHFCYPNGRWSDVGAEVRSVVEQAGFESAVMAEKGMNDLQTDRFRLLRTPMDPMLPAAKFALQVANPAFI